MWSDFVQKLISNLHGNTSIGSLIILIAYLMRGREIIDKNFVHTHTHTHTYTYTHECARVLKNYVKTLY